MKMEQHFLGTKIAIQTIRAWCEKADRTKHNRMEVYNCHKTRMVIVLKQIPIISSLENEAKFMFKRKRSSLIKKIWKFRKETKQTQPSEVESFRALLYTTLKQLSEDELHSLLKAVQRKGGVETPCLCPKYSSRRQRNVDHRFVFCKAFVYPYLKSRATLRTLQCCSSKADSDFNCVNPYHFSHIIDTGKYIIFFALLLFFLYSRRSIKDGNFSF